MQMLRQKVGPILDHQVGQQLSSIDKLDNIYYTQPAGAKTKPVPEQSTLLDSFMSNYQQAKKQGLKSVS